MRNFGPLAIGIGLTVLAGLTFATLDTLGKQLMFGLSVIQVLWARYVVHTAVSVGYLSLTNGWGFFRTRRPVLQTARGLMLLASSLCVYVSLPHVPLADVTAIVFFSPIVVTVLSALFLKERIGLHRLLGVLCGLAGVMLIVRPGFGETGLYHLLPLGGAFCNAIYLLITRQLADRVEGAAAQFHATAVGCILLTVPVAFQWETPSLETAGLLILLGVLAALGHQLVLRAFSHASASLLSPYLYGQVLFAALYSRLWFGDPLQPTMVAGVVLLVASGVYIWCREQHLRTP